MRFTYYTEKTVAQCMSALNERLQQKGTSRSPGLEGWVEKNGNFSIAVTTKVARRFPRTTRLQGKAERLGGVTIVKGSVADGAAARERIIIVVALAIVGAFIITTGNPLPGAAVIGAGILLNIPLAGDHQNSEYLTVELQKTLKAKTTPPVVVRKAAEVKRAAPARKPASAKKTASTAKTSAARKPTPAPKVTTPTAVPVSRPNFEPFGGRSVQDDEL